CVCARVSVLTSVPSPSHTYARKYAHTMVFLEGRLGRSAPAPAPWRHLTQQYEGCSSAAHSTSAPNTCARVYM
ncbi:MAG: hypothetical protein ACPIOQ_65000, partial [Promethearchaeia archaeon]